MRHLLIILSFLLLSSPVIGEETGILYYWERSSGDVWKTFGDDNTHPKYVGVRTLLVKNLMWILLEGSLTCEGLSGGYSQEMM